LSEELVEEAVITEDRFVFAFQNHLGGVVLLEDVEGQIM
jgi:hypothetical protein